MRLCGVNFAHHLSCLQIIRMHAPHAYCAAVLSAGCTGSCSQSMLTASVQAASSSISGEDSRQCGRGTPLSDWSTAPLPAPSGRIPPLASWLQTPGRPCGCRGRLCAATRPFCPFLQRPVIRMATGPYIAIVRKQLSSGRMVGFWSSAAPGNRRPPRLRSCQARMSGSLTCSRWAHACFSLCWFVMTCADYRSAVSAEQVPDSGCT